MATSPTLAALPPMPRPPAPVLSPDASETEVRQAAEELEGFFLGQMLETMFAGIKTDGPFGGGHGERMFRSLLVQEYGKIITAQGGIGLADNIARNLLQFQEIKHDDGNPRGAR